MGACGGDDDGATDLRVTWTFASGDCASNGIQTVRITWTPAGGAQQTADFACSAGQGTLGKLSKGASYSITGQGLDAGGTARVESFGQMASFPDGRAFSPITVTLRPKASDIVVSWNGCPASVILPYFISLYSPPAMPGGALGARIKQVQETCSSRKATLDRVVPGDYVVELDSRAVTPKVRATQAVTVVAGEDAAVMLNVP